jgi:hypothetical protein
MPRNSPNDPQALALGALTATLKDERRAERFLALTGIGTDELRAGLGDPGLLASVLSFLEAHEPDLVAVAGELEVDPSELVRAREALER